jgi:hypothetical protein
MSELIAITRLIENGYVTHEPTTREPYDLLVETPDGRYLKAQVKTAYVRDDRDGAIVVYARKNSGKAYTRAEADVIIGVYGMDVYLIDNAEYGEYWATTRSIGDRWRLLPSGGISELKAEVIG